MKILLVCTSGASTGVLRKKVEKYAEDNNKDIEIVAKGMVEYLDYASEYDVLLLGPQISFKQDVIKKESGKPVGVISPMDYGIGNAENVIKLAEKTIERGE